MTIRAMAFIARKCKRRLVQEEVEVDDPQAFEMHVRLVATGICHTDIAVRDGLMAPHFPSVLGHEGAGIVERVGEGVTRFQAGDKVVLSFNSCGKCSNCLLGHPAHCAFFDEMNLLWTRPDGTPTLWDAKGLPLGGNFFGQSSFSSHVLTHERNAVRIKATDEELPLFAPLGCGMQAGAGTVLNELRPQCGESIAIFGAGAVGLAAVMAANLLGANPIIVVDVIPERLELALQLGAHMVIDATHRSLRESIKKKVKYAVDTTGKSGVINEAMRHLMSRGAISSLAIAADNGPILAPTSHQRVIDSVAGDSNPQEFLPRLVDLYRKGDFPFDKLVRFYPASEINEAMEDSCCGRTIKPVLCFEAGKRSPH